MAADVLVPAAPAPPEDEAVDPATALAVPGEWWTRRRVVAAGTGLFGLGLGAGWMLRGRAADDTRFVVGTVEKILAAIEADGWFGFRPSEDDGEPSHAVIRWDPSLVTPGPDFDLVAMDIYGDRGANYLESNPVIDPTTGLMVLWLRSTHRGCRAVRCPTSGWFEDPCHGSRWNGWGEWAGGPAPRGLDKRQSWINDGRLVTNLRSLVPGIPREFSVSRQEPLGPDCMNI